MFAFTAVSKRYGAITAVNAVTLTASGGIVGLLGPNGAGKSTLLRLLTGYLAPDSGTVRVEGLDPTVPATRRGIGYLPEGAPLIPESTVAAGLDFSSRVRRLAPRTRRARRDELVQRLALAPLLARRTETLSKGERRRVALANAVLGDPTLLVLDEPTDGLDPQQRADVHGLIRELAQQRTVVVSTHVLDEAEKLCDRALILAQGHLLADAAPADLARRSRHHDAVTLEFPHDAERQAAQALLAAVPGVAGVETLDGHRLTALAQPGAQPFVAVAALVAAQRWNVAAMTLEQGRLEDVFLSLTGKERP